MNAHLKLSLAIPALLCLVFVAGAEDWSEFRGPGGRAVSSEKGLPVKWGKAEGLRWKSELPGRGLSCPVISRGRVFVTCSSGYRESRLHVLCFDSASGKKLWERQFNSTGSTNCHPKTCMAAPTPVVDARAVYALFATGDLAALDHDGNLLWYRSLVGDYPDVTNQVGMAASPALSGSTLLLPLENAGDSFAAGVDTRTGKNKWKVKRAREVNWVSPLVVGAGNGGHLAVFQTTKEATAYDPETGKVIWSYKGDLSSIPSPCEEGGLYVLPGQPTVAIKPGKTGTALEPLWSSGKLTGGYPSPLIHEGKVYGLTGAALTCVSAADGSELWAQRLTGPFAASPVLADGKIYVVSEKGVTTVVALGAKPTVVARNDLADTILCTPAVSGGAIFMRSDKWLYCIGK